MVRIIAGKGKGRKLKAPKGLTTRPTADRVKEAIFNILREKVVDAIFLDLFGGTGAIGIEAISRGAKKAVICEKDIKASQIIKENVLKSQFFDRISFLKMDAFIAIKILEKDDYQFDIIFLDPPYNKGLITKAMAQISARNLLAAGGLIIAEISSKEHLDYQDNKFFLTEKRSYGDTSIFIFTKKTNDIKLRGIENETN